MFALQAPAGYYSGSYVGITTSDLASKIGLTAAKIAKGNTILDIAGTGTSQPTITKVDGTATNGGWQVDLTSISGYANLKLYENIFPVTTKLYAGANEYNIPFTITYSNGIVKCVRSTGSASAPNAGACYVVTW